MMMQSPTAFARARASLGETHWYALMATHQAGLRERTWGARKEHGRFTGGELAMPVERLLEARGFSVYVPAETKYIRRNKYRRQEKKRVYRALFPGLVWAEIADDRQWYRALTTPFVRGVLMGDNGKPRPFYEFELCQIDAMVRQNTAKPYHKPMPTNRAFDPGDKVEFTDGPMSGMVFDVQAIDGDMAKITACLFGSERLVKAHLSNLAKVA